MSHSFLTKDENQESEEGEPHHRTSSPPCTLSLAGLQQEIRSNWPWEKQKRMEFLPEEDHGVLVMGLMSALARYQGFGDWEKDGMETKKLSNLSEEIIQWWSFHHHQRESQSINDDSGEKSTERCRKQQKQEKSKKKESLLGKRWWPIRLQAHGDLEADSFLWSDGRWIVIASDTHRKSSAAKEKTPPLLERLSLDWYRLGEILFQFFHPSPGPFRDWIRFHFLHSEPQRRWSRLLHLLHSLFYSHLK